MTLIADYAQKAVGGMSPDQSVGFVVKVSPVAAGVKITICFSNFGVLHVPSSL